MKKLLIRKLNFIPLLLCLWLPTTNFAQAQKKISGKATDEKNFYPIPLTELQTN